MAATQKIYVLLIYVILVVATFIAYEHLRHNEFVYDDHKYVDENTQVQEGINLRSVFWAFTSSHASNWHPLTWLSHMLDCHLFGLNPLGHHLTNLLFHILNTLLLFWVLKRSTGAVWASGFVAAAFAIHPLHVESVAWVAERKDVLSGFFWMLTIAAYLRYVNRPRIGAYFLMLLSFALGLMAKPMLVTLPFVLLLLDYWPLGRFQNGRPAKYTNRGGHKSANIFRQWRVFYCLLWEKIPLFILTAVSSVITYIVQQSGEAMRLAEISPLHLRLPNILVSYLGYICKLFYPSRLAVFYPYPGDSLPAWKPILSFVILVVLSASIIYTGRRRRYLLVGWLWYLGTLVPVIGLVQVGAQVMADRYTYLPSIGIFILVGWGAAEFAAKWRYCSVGLGIAATVVLTGLLSCTRMQVRYWENDITLFGRTLAVTENNYITHKNYGHALVRKGQLDDAVTHFKKAIECFNKVVGTRANCPDAYNTLGLAYAQQGEYELAIRTYKEALLDKPDHTETIYNLGMALKQQGKINQAIEAWENVLEIEPDYLNARISLAYTLGKLGKVKLAVEHYYKILQSKPDSVTTLNNLAWILATTEDTNIRNSTDAVKFAEKACKLTDYKWPSLLDTLAVAYAAAGRFPEAVETAEKAIKSAASTGKKDMVQEIQNRLQLYKAGQPYREP
jgi:tetratricopeptide (TPR) repeat protein